MSVTGRLDFTDLDSPQAMPPIARAERAHRRNLGRVHSEMHSQELRTPPGSPLDSTSRRFMRTPESYQDLMTPERASRSTPTSRTSRMSDQDMIAMLTARLEDAMVIVSTQQRMLREHQKAAVRREYDMNPTEEKLPVTTTPVKMSTRITTEVAPDGYTVAEPQHENPKISSTIPQEESDEAKSAAADISVAGKESPEPSSLSVSKKSSIEQKPPSQSMEQTTESPPVTATVTHSAHRPPKLKDIHCRRFTGVEKYPGLGAGVEDFLNEFESAVRMERLLNKSQWSSELRASVLGTFLEDQAARAYHELAGTSDVSYEVLTAHLMKEFGCRLSQYELGKRLDTTKRAGDTWKEYVSYLKFIERLMEGDRSQLLLETVCNNACPDLKSTLLSKVDETNTNYNEELNKVVDFLIRLKGDGRRVGHNKQGGKNNPPRQQQHQGAPAGNSQKKQGWQQQQRGHSQQQQHGHNQQSKQRQRSKQQSQSPRQTDSGHANTSTRTFRCWNCDEPGHREADCPSPKKQQHGSAHQARPQSSQSDDDGDGSADLWMATSVTNRHATQVTSWLVDSGASHHMCSSADMLFGISPSDLVITVANGGLLQASVKGSCLLRVQSSDKTTIVMLHEVHFVPGLERNLLSVTELGEHGISSTFSRTQCRLINSYGTCVAVAARQGKLWILNGETVKNHEDAAAMFVGISRTTLQQWHERLGHVNFQDLLRMHSKGLTSDMEVLSKKLRFCLTCAEAKQTKSAQPTADTSTSAPTDEIGAVLGIDLKTDMNPDRNGNKHLLTIVDYGSSFNRVYLLQSKNEAAEHVMNFVPEFQRQYGVTVKVVRTDGGGEFQGREFVAFLKRHGIRQQLTLPDSSASNGKVERMHRTIMNAGRAMLWASKLPERYWGDAARYASYIRNHLPTRANADFKAPLHVLLDKPPKVGHILKFGSSCTVHVAHKAGASLKKRAEKGIVIGVSEQQKGYRILIPRTKKIVVSADVQNVDKLDVSDNEARTTLAELHGESGAEGSTDAFDSTKKNYDENPANQAGDQGPSGADELDNSSPSLRSSKVGMVLRSQNQKRKKQNSIDAASDSGEDEYAGSPVSAAAIRRVFGTRKKSRTADFSLPHDLITEVAGSASLMLTTAMTKMITPRNLTEAMATPEWPEWKAAIEKELADLQANGTWEVVRAPAGANMISSKWVFRIKFNNRGELERFKARLVARGFTQRYGIDFDQTYSPVLKITSLRLLVALAALWKRRLRQGDVPNAYVKAPLDRPILMKPPKGTPVANGTAWLLLKSLYGLKQSGLLWNREMNAFLLSLGFTRSKMDPCLYFRRYNSKLTLLGLYVDDVIIVSEVDADSDWVMRQLGIKFDIKDMGVAAKCLGISIEHTNDGILLHQHDTIEELLREMGMAECRPVSTPMDPSIAFDDDLMMEQTTIMRRAIGSLLWISNCTRPDITAAVNYLARFVARPRQSHWQGVKRVLRYLRGTTAFGLNYKYGQGVGSKVAVTIYSDADWAGDSTDAKSVSGAVLMVNSSAISWASKKQASVALSTMESEYVAAAMAMKDAVWVKQLLVELRLWTAKEAVLLQVDNQSAIKSMTNEMSSPRTKHINIRYHFIRDVIQQGDVTVKYCPTQQQIADIMTKPLQRIVFERLRDQLHMVKVVDMA